MLPGPSRKNIFRSFRKDLRLIVRLINHQRGAGEFASDRFLAYRVRMNTKETRKRWLSSKMQKAGITQGAVSRRLGIDRASMSRVISGEREFRLLEAAEFCRMVKIRISTLVRFIEEQTLFS
ncbi:MAG: hypothetical protein A2603_02495 [Bdellovibrionales bacterium RIFOXYD1_FULL_55_31]|nr:MAG: hypothetical protein A2603_02495 [Bdellovibrionales bacterium RIFOXYD1_FULL_55_31]